MPHIAIATVTHKYTGQELDEESELYYYKARYYDPSINRFLTADTIIPDPSNAQAFNRYSYVINNPIKYTDPTGHKYKSKDELWDEWKATKGDWGKFWKKKRKRLKAKGIKSLTWMQWKRDQLWKADAHNRPKKSKSCGSLDFGCRANRELNNAKKTLETQGKIFRKTWSVTEKYLASNKESVAFLASAVAGSYCTVQSGGSLTAGGACSGAVNAAVLSIYEGKAPDEVLKDSFRGAIVGAVAGGIAGEFASKLPWYSELAGTQLLDLGPLGVVNGNVIFEGAISAPIDTGIDLLDPLYGTEED